MTDKKECELKTCPVCGEQIDFVTNDARVTQSYIVEACQEIQKLLLAKNIAYGNSALDPVRIFSKASPIEQLHVRIDDKLSRLVRGRDLDQVPEDTVSDLIGYLILLKEARGQGHVE